MIAADSKTFKHFLPFSYSKGETRKFQYKTKKADKKQPEQKVVAKRTTPRYLGKLRLTKSVVGSIVWWAKDGGGRGFVQVSRLNGHLWFDLVYPNSEAALENQHLLNTKTPDHIAAVFVDENGQSDPAWIDLKREVLIQCD